ncbi:hypothetical protein AOR02nite_12460 [Acetobacter orientalis]|uniref:Uncharacterized protein n=1 Tax=Acetobacter orientalis TaxID=146474 RepID=A0A0D6NH02_9PROT|nr:hypothetical protein Abor_002_044 [Acetobacter orientalis]GEL61404.1 hypothetical protein AOR02nite_12460 [Acetobacter orientalis]
MAEPGERGEPGGSGARPIEVSFAASGRVEAGALPLPDAGGVAPDEEEEEKREPKAPAGLPAPGWLAFWPELDAAGLVSSGLRLLNKNTPAMLAAVLRQRIYKYL